MPLLEKHLRGLLSQIYDAGSGDWEPLLEEIKQFLGGSASALVSHDFKRNQGLILFAKGYNQQLISSYSLAAVHQNVWLAREQDYRPPGKIHVGEHLVPERQLLRTRFYTEWLEPQHLHHRLCAVLSREQSTAVFLEVMRPRESAGFERDDIERCHLLLPHVQHALRMHRRMTELETERDAALGALDQLPWGVMLVDEHRTRLAANRHAQEILVAGDGLIARGNTLRADLADETARLERLLSGAFGQSGRASVGGTLSITRPSGAPPLNVVIVPLHIKTEALSERRPMAAIFVTDPDTRLDTSNQQQLRELYSLTAVEARLAAWLLQGKSVEAAAAEMGITVNTARAYLKRVYHKTGVRRQSELVRILLLALPRLRGDQPQTTQ